MQPVVTAPPQLGRAPLVAWSSKPATAEMIDVAPLPCWSPWPLSASVPFWMAPLGIASEAACVMVEIGRGAEYTGTRRVGRVVSCGANSTRPLASARNCRGNPSCWASTVGSIVFVSRDGSEIVNVSVAVVDESAPTVTVEGDTEYATPGIAVSGS